MVEKASWDGVVGGSSGVVDSINFFKRFTVKYFTLFSLYPALSATIVSFSELGLSIIILVLF